MFDGNQTGVIKADKQRSGPRCVAQGGRRLAGNHPYDIQIEHNVSKPRIRGSGSRVCLSVFRKSVESNRILDCNLVSLESKEKQTEIPFRTAAVNAD